VIIAVSELSHLKRRSVMPEPEIVEADESQDVEQQEIDLLPS